VSDLIEQKQAALRAPFPPEEVGKLPRIVCSACSKSSTKVCGEHAKTKCEACGNYITTRHIHLDYVGHAELTDRLLDVDPLWSWEPAAWTSEGTPAISQHGSNLVMWGRLTLCGVTRLGVGTAPANKDDAHKELIGDFLRNAAMRFGVALDLWRKSEKAEMQAEHPEEHHEPVDGPISEANADALVARCAEKGIDVREVVKLGTGGRTDQPAEVLRSEIKGVKEALDELAAETAA
jgi:hypothetical protein